ncbi:bifunctional 2-polyprenyl-6-hydroxyphenol methylase/3-demethylubiquinol 3-O-methyltransferase UbiG [Halieaceae bacterium IMCC14734]|uniref:Ubiquinone biosynthesis O-methyltransferase n=1 Tax=Candidatus Litorirhabdus singularis TaxID=2518993 RepID=A0ABT3TIE1_9GAMM|nr:bifunctional 2-polyprenyl-6-hydroxyphenol methylase/3-demethylubiquinol 3-O-methyltransferase UbiG [Candidatus Litorirhabdus singularis]MCX2981164.1 bifunctional 2-polyprenyl-6-hydroxyphenol methylase/3-demethylubiquinol 3-O-methyltransferase UbiG [Candidatus Litorirhabdus singularis]
MTSPELNVDPQEIAKFEELASRWWDKQSEFKPLHEINPLRANYIDERSPVAGKRLIDIGCGGGILAEAMALRGADVTGVDMGEAPLSVARIHQLESGVEVNYQQATAEQMAAKEPASYDIVCCLEMLEHVPDPAAVIAACGELCKPGGNLYFSTLNRNPKSYLFAIVGAEHILNLLPKGTHDYGKFIRPSELGAWVRAAGLQLESMTGLLYNPITKHYRLDPRDVSVNYMVSAVKPA